MSRERNVVADPPLVLDHHVRAVFVEELKNLGKDNIVGEEDAGEKETEANCHCGPESLALRVVHSRQNKLQDKVEKEGEGNDDPREKRELDGKHEALGRLQCLHEDEFAASVYARAWPSLY